MPTIEHAEWTGSYAITELVGRQDDLAAVTEMIAAAQREPQVIFVSGLGGIGKSRFLRELLTNDKQVQQYTAATSIVDVFDLDAHSPVGFVERIVQALAPNASVFASYFRWQQALAEQEAMGTRGSAPVVEAERDLRRLTFDAFADDLAAFAANGRVVIAIDTAEHMVYVSDATTTTISLAEGWRWLAKRLPTIRNVSWLVGGRVQAQELMNLIPEGVAQDSWTLQPLDDSLAVGYFAAAADAARARGHIKTAALIEATPQAFREAAARYAGGKPIMLGLITDLMLVQGLPAVQGFVNAQPQGSIDQAIITRMLETPELGRFLVAAGRLRKGFTVDSMHEALRAFNRMVSKEQLGEQFEQFRELSFVKERDGRLFLHDIMYEMLDNYVYRKPTDQANARRFFDVMLDYNDREIRALRHKTDELYMPVEVKGKADELDREALVDLNKRRRALLTERLYYLLRRDAVRGFRHYFRVTFDAVLSSDVTLDIELEAEIWAFLNEYDPSGHQEFVKGLERAVCAAIARLRVVARPFAAGLYDEAITKAEEIRQMRDTAVLAGAGTIAILGFWEAYARIYRAKDDDLAQAKRLLDSGIQTLQAVMRENDVNYPSRVWRSRGGLAFGYQVRGYLNSTRRHLEAATHDYTLSIRYGRDVRLNVILATALNDLGFVRAEAGDVDDGRALVSEALALRQERGPRVPVAFSLNTLALLNIREGRFREAVEKAQLALATFRALGHKRGETLALIALAEAKRRYASGTPSLPHEQRLALLDEARSHSDRALERATELGERIRQVEALIESGCALRDMLRLPQGHHSEGRSVTSIAAASEEALNLAAELAGTTYLYRRLDALVNFGYLRYYSGEPARVEEALLLAEQTFPAGYFIKMETGAPAIEREQASVLLWIQLAKLHALRGHVAFDRYQYTEGEQKQVLLQEAIKNYLLSLKYNELYSSEHHGMRQLRNQVYGRLKEASYAELRNISQAVQVAEVAYSIPDSALRRLLHSRALWVEAD